MDESCSVTRRLFVTGSLAMIAAPLAAEAQRAGKVPRVGYLSPFSGSDPEIQRGLDVFRQKLRELGYVEGQSVAIDRWADGKAERLPDLAWQPAGVSRGDGSNRIGDGDNADRAAAFASGHAIGGWAAIWVSPENRVGRRQREQLTFSSPPEQKNGSTPALR